MERETSPKALHCFYSSEKCARTPAAQELGEVDFGFFFDFQFPTVCS
jgi:hypothetical protein